MEKILNITVDEYSLSARLDKYLAGALEEQSISREKLKKLIIAGKVSISGRVEDSPRYMVRVGDEIEVKIAPQKPMEILPKDIDLDIVYEDEDVIVINKQAGLTTHPGAGTDNDTLVNALLHYNKENLSKIGGLERPGIVHRLDRNTTGLIIVAKNDAAHLHLSKQLEERSLKKEYVAIVWGMLRPDVGTIDKNIARSSRNRKLMETVEIKGKKAVTHYETEEIFHKGLLSKVICNLETGRTHQIRVHMSSEQHSIFGDLEYGHHLRKLKRFFEEDENKELFDFKRQALHAYKISFIHPRTGKKVSLTADLPEDMERLIEKLRG